MLLADNLKGQIRWRHTDAPKIERPHHLPFGISNGSDVSGTWRRTDDASPSSRVTYAILTHVPNQALSVKVSTLTGF